MMCSIGSVVPSYVFDVGYFSFGGMDFYCTLRKDGKVISEMSSSFQLSMEDMYFFIYVVRLNVWSSKGSLLLL